MSHIPEKDWKLLRELTPLALERLCVRILEQAKSIASAPGGTSHEQYLKLYHPILEQNDEVAMTFDDHRRSTAFLKILQMHRRKLFTDEEFSRFTEETRMGVLDLSR